MMAPGPDAAPLMDAIIVDDEPLARSHLAELLRQVGGVRVVGEGADGRDGLRLILRHQPALAFLDVAMPELGGFDLLRHLPRERHPTIIFVTAHSEFAMPAFDADAADYLLKPFDAPRLRRALIRARALRLRSAASALSRVDIARAWRQEHRRVVVKSRDGLVFLEPSSVDWIESAGNNVKLHAGADMYTMRATLASITDRLDPRLFVRISRSALANVGSVVSLARRKSGGGVLTLSTGVRLTVSRRYHTSARAALAAAGPSWCTARGAATGPRPPESKSLVGG